MVAGRYPHRLSTVFFTGEPGSLSLWIMDADGSNPEQLTDFKAGNPAFSPDGERIVFTRMAGSLSCATSAESSSG